MSLFCSSAFNWLLQADVDKAVAAAKAAFKIGSPWRKLDASARGKLLNKVYHIISYLFSFRESVQDYKNPYGYGKSQICLNLKVKSI